MEKLTVYDICLKITGDFEGRGFGTVTDNFDGQGLSCGIIQFNLGQGTLQNYILNHINEMMYDFPLPITPLIGATPNQAMTWHKDNCLDVNGKLKKEWRAAWEAFMIKPAIINLQKRACDKYFHQAKCIVGKLGFTHENVRAMAFAFDIAVQSWALIIDTPKANKQQAESIKELSTTENYIWWVDKELSEEQQVLLITAHLRSLKCKPEYKMNFFTRKAAIAIGCGIVNNTKYDFNKLFTES